jgi:hypothetical protein
MDDELLENMRDRIERCRRLASLNNDRRTSAALLEMAADGENDLRRLEAKRGRRITFSFAWLLLRIRRRVRGSGQL